MSAFDVWTAPLPASMCHRVIVGTNHMRGAIQMQIPTIGLDIAKNVFQVHGIDARERVVVRKQFRRGQVMKFFEALPPCLIGLEACASAHHWARKLAKPNHEVRLMAGEGCKGLCQT